MKSHLIILFTALTILLSLVTNYAHADGRAVVPDDVKQHIETQGWSQQWHDELYEHDNPGLGLAIRQMLRAKRDADALDSGLVAHEWGSLQHHLGTATSEFDRMGEDQSDLPSFVKVWTDQPQSGPILMRKPILYFYTKKTQKINVTVRFPEGLLTQWYPDATHVAPQNNGQLRPQDNQALLNNGTLSWQEVELNPDLAPSLFSNVRQDHPWWHTARETDATPLQMTTQRSGRAIERFLFYRGVGTYTPMVTPKRDDNSDAFSVTVPFSQIDLRGVFLVSIDDSGATITHAPVLKAQSTLKLAGPESIKPTEEAATIAKGQLTEALEAAGLFPKEAEGLVKIWGDDMFTTPGQRLLYFMPDNEVERVLPLTIDPKPSQKVRTLIAWVELATPQAEKRITDLIAQLGSDDTGKSDDAFKELESLDRFAEAILRRSLDTIEDEAVKAKINQILNTLDQKRRQGLQPRR